MNYGKKDKMAKYHLTAEKLKPIVLNADFNKDQLNIILDLMRSCSQLRQRKVIESLFILVLPDKFKVEKEVIDGMYGEYEQIKVIE